MNTDTKWREEVFIRRRICIVLWKGKKKKIEPFSISIHFGEQPYKTRKIWQYMKSFILISN